MLKICFICLRFGITLYFVRKARHLIKISEEKQLSPCSHSSSHARDHRKYPVTHATTGVCLLFVFWSFSLPLANYTLENKANTTNTHSPLHSIYTTEKVCCCFVPTRDAKALFFNRSESWTTVFVFAPSPIMLQLAAPGAHRLTAEIPRETHSFAIQCALREEALLIGQQDNNCQRPCFFLSLKIAICEQEDITKNVSSSSSF
jgi:hypothetical protein